MLMKARLVCTALFVPALLAWAIPSHASSISFTFDCTVQNTTPATCTASQPVGTVTLTDSVVDPNRVDLNVTLFSSALSGVTGLDKLFLNYDNSVTVGGATHRTFGLVSQSALAGDHASAGNTNINFNAVGPFHTMLDLSVDPNNNPGLTFAGSLVVYSTDGPLHAESNLDVSMFDDQDANGLLYAAFNTLGANQNQQYGALTMATPGDPVSTVPEPATLTLLGTSLVGLAYRLRSRKPSNQ